MLPDRWAAANPEAILTHRLEESRAKAARTRQRLPGVEPDLRPFARSGCWHAAPLGSSAVDLRDPRGLLPSSSVWAAENRPHRPENPQPGLALLLQGVFPFPGAVC